MVSRTNTLGCSIHFRLVMQRESRPSLHASHTLAKVHVKSLTFYSQTSHNSWRMFETETKEQTSHDDASGHDNSDQGTGLCLEKVAQVCDLWPSCRLLAKRCEKPINNQPGSTNPHSKSNAAIPYCSNCNCPKHFFPVRACTLHPSTMSCW